MKEPYYMNLSEGTGNFFECKPDLPINERKWPHFISFLIKDYYRLNDFTNVGKRGKFSKIFADSVNYGGGVPVLVHRDEYDSLVDLFNSNR